MFGLDKSKQVDPISQDTVTPTATPTATTKETSTMDTPYCTTPCLLNPGSGEVIARANMVQDTLSHSTQRGIRNADVYDKYLDTMLLHDAKFASTIENLCLTFATVADDSAMNENQATQQNSDTTKKTAEEANAAMAVSLGNLATAVLPILTAASGEGTAITFGQLTNFLANIVAAAAPAPRAAA